MTYTKLLLDYKRNALLAHLCGQGAVLFLEDIDLWKQFTSSYSKTSWSLASSYLGAYSKIFCCPSSACLQLCSRTLSSLVLQRGVLRIP